MTGVAHHINEMKRQHEVAVHVQVGIKLVPACACYGVHVLPFEEFNS